MQAKISALRRYNFAYNFSKLLPTVLKWGHFERAKHILKMLPASLAETVSTQTKFADFCPFLPPLRVPMSYTKFLE